MASASIAVRFEFGIEIGGPPNSVISGTKNVDPKSEERRTKMPTEAWGACRGRSARGSSRGERVHTERRGETIIC